MDGAEWRIFGKYVANPLRIDLICAPSSLVSLLPGDNIDFLRQKIGPRPQTLISAGFGLVKELSDLGIALWAHIRVFHCSCERTTILWRRFVAVYFSWPPGQKNRCLHFKIL